MQAVQAPVFLTDPEIREYPLKGKVYCGCCDHALSRIAQKKPFYMCRHSTADVTAAAILCERTLAGLEEAVLITLKKQLEILLPAHEDGTLHLDATAAKCSEYEKQLEDLRNQKQALFERYLLGQIELDTYKSRKTDYGRRNTESQKCLCCCHRPGKTEARRTGPPKQTGKRSFTRLQKRMR